MKSSLHISAHEASWACRIRLLSHPAASRPLIDLTCREPMFIMLPPLHQMMRLQVLSRCCLIGGRLRVASTREGGCRSWAEVRRKLDEQQERMTDCHVTDEDIVRLNVGGHHITTTRGTLCQAEESYLASLCSGRWDTTTKDESGAYFLDLDPECMTILMRYLRQRRLTPSDQAVPPPEIKKDLAAVWQATIEYLGLTDFIDDEFEPRLELDLVFGDTLTRTADGYYIPCRIKNTCQAICTKPLTKTTAWRFRVGDGYHSRPHECEIRFGVFKEIDTDVLFQMGKKSLYGWSSQGNAYQEDDGSRFETPYMVVDGDVVHLRLNFEGSHLELWNQRLGRVFKISLPREQTKWYFQVYMNGSYWVQTLPLSRAEALTTFPSSG